VSNVDVGRSTMSFDVSDVGTPVLVRVSYFPNWEADGADGPYRVSPNLMVVVPTDSHVELRYGRAPIDVVSFLFTLLGILGVIWLTRQPAIDMNPRPRGRDAPTEDVNRPGDAAQAPAGAAEKSGAVAEGRADEAEGRVAQ
jgi:hypothetical protein